jgi:hypothetical protein
MRWEDIRSSSSSSSTVAIDIYAGVYLKSGCKKTSIYPGYVATCAFK